jgi:DNA-binding transcriptional regulator YdaS (Cro superfamily)
VDFKTFWQGKSQRERAEFAAAVGSTSGYLDHVATGYRLASVNKLAVAIERESRGLVTRVCLRPDVFGFRSVSSSPAPQPTQEAAQ